MLTRSQYLPGGIMGLYKRGSTWWMCFFVESKKVRRSTRTTSKKLAQKIYEKAKGEVAQGKFQISDKLDMPFDMLVDECLEKHSKVEKKSYLNDLYQAKMFKRFFKSTPIGKIAAYDFKAWRQWRSEQTTIRGNKIKIATLNRELKWLKKIFSLAVEWGWITENPALKIKCLKGETHRTRFLANEEVARLIENSIVHLKPIIIAAISTGMRRGEIFDLKWKDVDIEHGFIRVEKTKNSESREIPINPYLSETLQGMVESRKLGNYVFCNEDGKKWCDIRGSFQSALRRSGIKDFRFHDLRHTAASLYASRGCDLVTLQHLLGHKSINMTMRYAHLLPSSHERTRKIMQEFWVEVGDTKVDTGILRANEKIS
jgi:integrase